MYPRQHHQLSPPRGYLTMVIPRYPAASGFSLKALKSPSRVASLCANFNQDLSLSPDDSMGGHGLPRQFGPGGRRCSMFFFVQIFWMLTHKAVDMIEISKMASD